MDEQMYGHVLSPDTQAILLLCGRFSKTNGGDAQPLTQSEHNRLIKWLRGRKLSPASLVQLEGQESLSAADLPVESWRLQALLERGGALALVVEGWDNQGIWVLSRYDSDDYPQRLTDLGGQAPPLLYGTGEKKLLSYGGIAVVGSRDADEEALEYTQTLARACAGQGIQIVSGGARGIDSAAILTALEAGGTAVGVLPDSLGKASLSGKYREALMEKNLVLISPYDPSSGFNVGNAMGRNKYVYALADRGLVVSTSAGRGGTWEGAIEALKREFVYVRMAGNAPEGNRQLLEMGALAFPEQPWDDLAQIILGVGTKQSAPEMVQNNMDFDSESVSETQPSEEMEVPQQAKTGAAQHNPTPTAFDAVLPLLLEYLKQPRDVKSLAASLDVRSGQAEDWIKIAMEKGQVTRQGKPVRYIAKHQEPTLFALEGAS
jgi:predicted Rossmann fold nucleotide-binding protein DprA/Smf involved in DNA uptake